jgi:hypothetical protein
VIKNKSDERKSKSGVGLDEVISFRNLKLLVQFAMVLPLYACVCARACVLARKMCNYVLITGLHVIYTVSIWQSAKEKVFCFQGTETVLLCRTSSTESSHSFSASELSSNWSVTTANSFHTLVVWRCLIMLFQLLRLYLSSVLVKKGLKSKAVLYTPCRC